MSRQKLPYQTTNTALAVVAFLFRIPVTRKKVYTEDFLKSRRLTAKEAFRRGEFGEVTYAIDTSGDEDYSKIIRAFNEEKLRIEEGQDTVPLEIDPEMAARFACRVLYARKSFFKSLTELIPFLRIMKPGKVNKTKPAADGSHTVTHPGFIEIRLDADEETRNHLFKKGGA